MNNICIYHKNCADGFGAALAVKLHLDSINQECEFLSAHYGDEIPDVTGKDVYIVDFSYPRKDLIAMHMVSNSIIVLDHHKTAQADLDGLDFCKFDMNKSGAMMAWNEFHSIDNVPLLIQHIQDRDLWRFELHGTKEISAGLRLMPMDFKKWTIYLDNNELIPLYEIGVTVLKYEEVQVKRAIDKELSIVNIAGYMVPCINTTTLISEIGQELCKDYHFAVMYFETHNKRIYSLRSNEDGIDVSEIAKKFGGGGHARAAGFTVDKPILDLTEYIEK